MHGVKAAVRVGSAVVFPMQSSVVILLYVVCIGFVIGWAAKLAAQAPVLSEQSSETDITTGITQADIARIVVLLQAQLEVQQTDGQKPYLMYLDAVERLPDRVHSDKLQIIMAEKVEQYTLAVPALYTTDLVWQRLNKYFVHNYPELRRLFACAGRLCGRSNIWANQVFQRRQLLGLDGTQYYQIALLHTQDVSQYVIFYVVQRGTKAIYVQVDLVTAEHSPAPIP